MTGNQAVIRQKKGQAPQGCGQRRAVQVEREMRGTVPRRGRVPVKTGREEALRGARVSREYPQRALARRHPSQAEMRRIRRRNRAAKRFFLLAFLSAICFGGITVLRGIPELFSGLPSVRTEENIRTSRDLRAYFDAVLGVYPEDLVALFEKNEEAHDYVLGYPEREEYKSRSIDLAEELAADLADGEVPLLMQWDRRWGYDDYGNSMIGLAGCGPLCMEMAYLHFTQDMDMTPRDMAAFASDRGYHTEAGTSWSFWTEGAASLGLEGAELSLDENAMKRALDSGGLIVCSMRPGDFTTTGHFILIRGYSADGFYVNDPNRRSNSRKVWDYGTLRGQIKNLWVLQGGAG